MMVTKDQILKALDMAIEDEVPANLDDITQDEMHAIKKRYDGVYQSLLDEASEEPEDDDDEDYDEDEDEDEVDE